MIFWYEAWLILRGWSVKYVSKVAGGIQSALIRMPCIRVARVRPWTGGSWTYLLIAAYPRCGANLRTRPNAVSLPSGIACAPFAVACFAFGWGFVFHSKRFQATFGFLSFSGSLKIVFEWFSHPNLFGLVEAGLGVGMFEGIHGWDWRDLILSRLYCWLLIALG